MIVLVTPAEQDLARLDLEIADRLGEPRDPRMEAIAKAAPADPPSDSPLDRSTAVTALRRAGYTSTRNRSARSGMFVADRRGGSQWIMVAASGPLEDVDRHKLAETLEAELAILSGQVEPSEQNE